MHDRSDSSSIGDSDAMSEPEPLVDDLLTESAPLAQRMAASLCAPDPDADGTCAWYHGVWQYWRLMGLAPAVGGQGRFLIETLRALGAEGDRSRLLVSGCGDHGLPAHVLRAYALAGADLDLTVIDRCETPLFLTRWYADRQGRPVSTRRSDALEYESPTQFDVVVSNSFLSYFDTNDRQRLFTVWRRLLRPGGKVVLTNRVRPGASPEPVGFSPDEARAFVEAARRAGEVWRERLGFEGDQVVDWARTWAAGFRAYPVRAIGEIEAGLREAGFVPDLLELETYPGAVDTYPGVVETRVSGRATSGRAEHARVVATRL